MNKDYFFPGIAAIVAAVLYPAYYLYLALTGGLSPSEEFLREEMALTFLDWVFFALGGLMFYVFYSLKRILHDHHNYRGVDVLLNIIMGFLLLLHGGLFLLDTVATIGGSGLSESTFDGLVTASVVLFIGSIFAFGAVDLLLGIILWRNRTQLSQSITMFAVIWLIVGLLELTFILSIATVLIMPVGLCILAALFLKRPEEIEVV